MCFIDRWCTAAAQLRQISSGPLYTPLRPRARCSRIYGCGGKRDCVPADQTDGVKTTARRVLDVPDPELRNRNRAYGDSRRRGSELQCSKRGDWLRRQFSVLVRPSLALVKQAEAFGNSLTPTQPPKS